MASHKERPNTLDNYNYNKPLFFGDMTASLFNMTALSDTREEDKQEAKQKPKKRRDDE